MAHPRPARRAGPTMVVACLILALAPPAAAPAELAGTTPPAGSASGDKTITLEGVAPGDHEITLISGDRVTLRDTGGGRYRIEVSQTRRADGTTPSMMDISAGPDGAYVVPDDGQLAIAAGTLDRQLFNVKLLAESGYTDAAVDATPVIVQQPEASAARVAAALPGARLRRDLPVIDAAAVSVPKAGVAEVWEALRREPASSLRSAPATRAPRVWLDRMNRVALADSVPQVGAPQAWAAGHDGTGATVAVLDTGIDAGHPDLAGRVADAESFVPGVDVTDGHGHGTHVASTVAGTGAASEGTRKGVAPGAELLIGKICNNGGGCADSWVIAGMEWAAGQGADVVSMSIGSSAPSDGTDPLSQAVNRLTEQSGALFVIAAGNNGGDFSIASPGAADAALTVGAVTKADELAGFSRRGPRGPEFFGDYAIKPEIVAPGVDIVAARAARTGMGTPVDDHYTRASGTSMATPHVAGAAAILAAQHPDLSPEALKAALVSTAEDAGHTVYQQGGGRLDVARAVRQQLRVTPAMADFRAVDEGEAPPSRILTYTNPTAADITLDLTAAAAEVTTGAALELALSTPQPTVPAGGTASVTLTAGRAPAGTYSGRVTAVAPGGTRLTSPIGLGVPPPMHRLKVTFIPPAEEDCVGWTCPFANQFIVSGVDGPGIGYNDWVFDYDPFGQTGGDVAPGHVFAVPEGTYTVTTVDRWRNGDTGDVEQLGLLSLPEVEVTGDTELVIDANDARPVTVGQTPRPTERYASEHDMCYTASTGFTFGCSFIGHRNPWVLPSQPVAGSYEFVAQWLLGPPLVTMVTTGPDPLDLRPSAKVYDSDYPGASRFPAGTHQLPVVDVGDGAEEDYDRPDLAGALAFQSGSCGAWEPHWQRAASAGAVGLLLPVHPGCTMPRLGPIYDPWNTIPVAQIPPAETAALIDRLAAGPVTVTMTGTPNPGYAYRLSDHQPGGVPPDPSYQFDPAEMATVDHHLHSAEPVRVTLMQQSYFAGPSFLGPIGAVFHRLEPQAPATLRVYTAPAAPEVPLTWGLLVVEGNQPSPLCGLNSMSFPACEQSVDILPGPGGYAEVHWNAGPTAVGAPAVPDGSRALTEPPLCAGCRQGDTFVALTNLTTAQPGHWRGYVDAADSETQLFRDGQEVPATRLAITEPPYQGEVDSYRLPPEPADYRLTQRFGSVDTSWWFTSAQVSADRTPPETVCAATFQSGVDTPCAPEPLIFVRYDAGVDLTNSVAAPGAHWVRVGAYHQDPTAAEIAGVLVWYSTDGGDRWREARTLGPIRDGAVQALVVPPPRQTDGTVSLRVEAWDRDGNRVEQTILDAYGLTQRTPTNLTP